MRCPSCDRTYDDGLQFCPHDGTRLVAEPAPVASPVAGAPSSTNMGVVVAVLGAIIFVLGGAVAALALRDDAPEPRAEADVLDGPSEVFGGGVASAATDDPVDVEPADEELVELAPPPPARDLVEVRSSEPIKEIRASYGPARVETEGTGLILRAGPGRQHDVVAKMLPGDVVTVDGCDVAGPDGRWCAVVYGGVRGWALDTYLNIGGPATDTSSGLEDAFGASRVIGRSAYIDGSEVRYVNLRARPYVGSELLLRMPVGTSLFVVRCLPSGWSLGGRAIEGRWCFVTAERQGRAVSGWASDGALRW